MNPENSTPSDPSLPPAETLAPTHKKSWSLTILIVAFSAVVALLLTIAGKEPAYQEDVLLPTSVAITNSIDGLVTDYVRFGKAHVFVYQIFDDRASRSMLIRGVYAASPRTNPFRQRSAGMAALHRALVAEDQNGTKEAIIQLGLQALWYGKKFGTTDSTNTLEYSEFTSKDALTLSNARQGLIRSFDDFQADRNAETAERTFLQGWIYLRVLASIGPDYIGHTKGVGTPEIERAMENTRTLSKVLESFAETLKDDVEKVRVQKQAAHLAERTERLKKVLERFPPFPTS